MLKLIETIDLLFVNIPFAILVIVLGMEIVLLVPIYIKSLLFTATYNVDNEFIHGVFAKAFFPISSISVIKVTFDNCLLDKNASFSITIGLVLFSNDKFTTDDPLNAPAKTLLTLAGITKFSSSPLYPTSILLIVIKPS